MTIVVNPNEPSKKLFEDHIEDPMGFDYLLVTNRGRIPIERKQIPDDLISSVQDGRLARELRAMREVSRIYIVLLHGRFLFNKDNELRMGGHGRKWTKKGVHNLLRTIRYIEGADIEYAETDEELVEVVSELQEYFDQKHHLSLRVRPALESNWIVPTYEEKVRFWMQGLPHISAIRSKLLTDTFKTPMAIFGAEVGDLMSISGIGAKIARDIYNFLRGIE